MFLKLGILSFFAPYKRDFVHLQRGARAPISSIPQPFRSLGGWSTYATRRLRNVEIDRATME